MHCKFKNSNGFGRLDVIMSNGGTIMVSGSKGWLGMADTLEETRQLSPEDAALIRKFCAAMAKKRGADAVAVTRKSSDEMDDWLS